MRILVLRKYGIDNADLHCDYGISQGVIFFSPLALGNSLLGESEIHKTNNMNMRNMRNMRIDMRNQRNADLHCDYGISQGVIFWGHCFSFWSSFQ